MRDMTLKALSNVLAGIQITATAIQGDTNEVIQSGDHIALIKHFDTLRRVNEEIKIARKALENLEDQLSYTEIPDTFRRIGIKHIFVDDVGRVSIGHRWGCSMLDKQAGFQWLRENGHGGLIIETVNSSTLAAFAKNTVETTGKELPSDKFKTSINPYTSITKE